MLRVGLKSPTCPAVARSVSCRALERDDYAMSRRQLFESSIAVACGSIFSSSPSLAVMGMQPGMQDKNKGLAQIPDEGGYFLYQRPEEKMGGHGIGWTEIPRYMFKVPEGWSEKPTSIADLGGTEIDLRYTSENDSGTLSVVLAPIARFSDIEYNSDIRLEQLTAPDRLILGFGTELFGRPLEEEDVTNIRKSFHDGLLYYWYDVKPRNLVAITSLGNRVFILTVFASARQWRKAGKDLRVIQESFTVPTDLYDMQKELYDDDGLKTSYRG